MIEVSVIVPVFNFEKYLKRCLDSLINQSFSDLEVIIINDGSNDGSAKICEEYAKKYHWIRVIHKKNEGLGYARNSGLDLVTGRYIFFLDGDDYLLPDQIQNMYDAIIDNKADTCLTGHTRVYAKSKVEFSHACVGQTYEGTKIRQELLPRMCGKKNDGTDSIEMSVCTAMFSYDLIQKNQIRFHSEREFISEDIIFDFDYYPLSKKVCVSNSVGYCYCDNEGSLTTKYLLNRFDMQKKLTKELLLRSKDLDIYELCKDRIATTFLSIVRYCAKLEVKFSYNNGKAEAKKRILKMCQDEMVQSILSEYNNKQVPLKSRIINICIKRKLSNLIWLIMKVKIKLNI